MTYRIYYKDLFGERYKDFAKTKKQAILAAYKLQDEGYTIISVVQETEINWEN